MLSENGAKLIEFRETLYVPDLRASLISVSKITYTGNEVIFRRNNVSVRDQQGNEYIIAQRKGDLYYVCENVECAAAQPKSPDILK